MAVNLSPLGGAGAQFFDSNGNPLSGGMIYTYAAGTNTPQATYTSSSGLIQHSNPIVLDAAGRVPTGEIWLTDGVSYKFVIQTSAAVLVGTYDNIVGINSNFVAYTSQQEIQTATAGQTVFNLTTMQYQPATNNLSVFVDGVNQYGPGAQYAYVETDSDTVTFVNGLHVGASVKFTTATPVASAVVNAENVAYDPPFFGAVGTNVEVKLAQTINVADFGAISGTTTDQSSAFHDAFDAAKTAGIGAVYAEGTYRFTSNLVLRDGVSLIGPNKASLILEMDGCYVTNETGIGDYCENTNLMATITSVNGTEQYGLVLQGIQYSTFDVTISGFNDTTSVGLLLTSVLDGATWRYARVNTFNSILVENCYKGVVLTKDGADPATFGANFNTFNAGYINGYAITGIHIEFGEGNLFTNTRCTTSIGAGSIGWLIGDAVNTMVGCTGDGSFGGTVPGGNNTYGFPYGRNGDLTTVGFKFVTGSSGSCLYNPKGDACYNRITADSATTMNSINVWGRVGFNRINTALVQGIDFSQASGAGAGTTNRVLAQYDEGTWTPVFTFNTPGDLALSSVTANATYTKIGRLVSLICDYTFTPTFTTASGQAKITGIPFANSAQVTTSSVMTNGNTVTYPAGTTTILGQLPASTITNIFLYGAGSGVALAAVNATNFTSGSPVTLHFEVTYFANS